MDDPRTSPTIRRARLVGLRAIIGRTWTGSRPHPIQDFVRLVMPRRLALACVGLMLTAATTRAQSPLSAGAIPSRTALARVGLDLHWAGVVPLAGAEKVTSLSIDSDLLFAQTNLANFFAFEAESGRLLWTAHLGRVTSQSFPASVNSQAVFGTNSNQPFPLHRGSGRQIWISQL